jgi:hypothetical protein
VSAPAPAQIARQQRIACPACEPDGMNGVLFERIVQNARGREKLRWCNVCSYGFAEPLPLKGERRAARRRLIHLALDPAILALAFAVFVVVTAYAVFAS